LDCPAAGAAAARPKAMLAPALVPDRQAESRGGVCRPRDLGVGRGCALPLGGGARGRKKAPSHAASFCSAT
jgi:hypothetical protein